MANSSVNIYATLSDDEISGIPARISSIRKNELHLSQAQFASALNISQSYLSQLESGIKKISFDVLAAFQKSFGISPDAILHGHTAKSAVDYDSDFMIQHFKKTALDQVKSAYHLSSSDIDFIDWYASLDADRRTSLNDAIQAIRASE